MAPPFKNPSVLWYIANPGYQSGIAQEMDIDQTIKEVSNDIVQKAHLCNVLVLERLNRLKYQMLYCIVHMIFKPQHQGDEYINM